MGSKNDEKATKDTFSKNDDPQTKEGDGTEETEEEYRLRVYGAISPHDDASEDGNRGKRTGDRPSLIRQLSQSVSSEWDRRRRSSLKEQLPQTTYGWAMFLSSLSAMTLRYELGLQRSLTCPPLVYGQINEGPLKEIHEELTKSDASILRRDVQPSLFVGTRGVLSSSAAYMLGGPANSDRHVRFREMMHMPLDGAVVAVEWELPWLEENPATDEERKQETLRGTIQQPVVLVLHGLNNHADFGYVRSMMRTCVERGWIAAGLNLRGCGGVNFKTPRGYNGAYTGDIRCVVHAIVGRLSDQSCIFLVGNSLGANLITKYLGEEGLSGSLPKAVAGGVALGNPLVMNSAHISLLWSPLMALGAKKCILDNWSALKSVDDANVKQAVRRALLAVTLKQFDEAMAPIFVRNKSFYPFEVGFGFENADAYAKDAASYKVVRYIPVPLLTLAAKDDMIVYHPSRGRLSYCLENPNVMWVETMCGGHLGWQEAPPDQGNWGYASSWANSAAADFVEATLKARRRRESKGEMNHSGNFHDPIGNTIHIDGKPGFAERPQSRL